MIAVDARAVGYVIENGLRERIGFLEDHADALAHFHRVNDGRIKIKTLEQDSARHAGRGDQFVHAVETAQESALTAA